MTARTPSRRNSILIAISVAVGLSIWLASGILTGESDGVVDATVSERSELMSVSVTSSQSQSLTREISVSARTEPDREIELKAETRGRVVDIGADRGAQIQQGQTLARLDMRDRLASLDETEALIRQRELEFAAARRLQTEQFISEAELAAAEALLVSARAAKQRIELDIERTNISAPFDSIVADRFVEIGDYVDTGDSIARLVDIDPLIVVGYVNERDISALEVGNTGTARVLNGKGTSGVVRYIAPVADDATRSFRVELAIANPGRRLAVGTSAELILGAEEITAHDVPAALLALADDGTVGVKAVDESNRVKFYPVELAGSSSNGMLITGLPSQVRLIVVGQGFVTDGQSVIPVEATTGTQ